MPVSHGAHNIKVHFQHSYNMQKEQHSQKKKDDFWPNEDIKEGMELLSGNSQTNFTNFEMASNEGFNCEDDRTDPPTQRGSDIEMDLFQDLDIDDENQVLTEEEEEIEPVFEELKEVEADSDVDSSPDDQFSENSLESEPPCYPTG